MRRTITVTTVLTAVAIIYATGGIANAQPPPPGPSANFVAPTAAAFGFDRFDAGTTYAEWTSFSRTRVPAPGRGFTPDLPDNTPQLSFGLTSDATLNATTLLLGPPTVTGGSSIVNARNVSITTPGVASPFDGDATVLLQVDVSSDIAPSVLGDLVATFGDFDEDLLVFVDSQGVQTELSSIDAAIDDDSARVTEDSFVLSSLTESGIAPSQVTQTVASFALTGRNDDEPTFLSTFLIEFDVAASTEYTVDFGIDSNVTFRTAAIDTFTAVPEPTTALLGMLGLLGLAGRRHR